MMLAPTTTTQIITLKTGLKLGSATNLINGYRPTWNPKNPNELPFYAPKSAPLKVIDPVVESDLRNRFQFPCLSFHPNAESLISSLYRYGVLPTTTSEPEFRIPSGPLVLDDKDSDAARQALSDWLGVNLARDANLAYVLVEVRREVGSVLHPLIQGGVFGNPDIPSFLNEDFSRDLSKLRPGRGRDRGSRIHLTRSQTQQYLDFFQQYGTHFISSILAGDVVFQVFAYDADAFATIVRTYQKSTAQTSGPFAVDFDYFTTPRNQTGFGYVAEAGYGHILCLSHDPALTTSVSAGKWQEDQWSRTNSIFAPYINQNNVELFGALTEITAIAFELKPLDSFAEYYRAMNWRRIFKGALYQKFGDRINPGFVNESICSFLSVESPRIAGPYYGSNPAALNEPDPLDCSLTQIYPQPIEGFVSTITTPTINVYKERLDLSQVQLIDPDQVQDLTVLTNALQIPKRQPQSDPPYALPGDQVSLVAHVVEIDMSAGVPKLVLSEQGFANFTLVCEEFLGALEILTQDDKSGRQVIVDGFYYTVGANTVAPERYGVTISKDVFTPPSEEFLLNQLPNLEFSLAASESVMYTRSTPFAQVAQTLITKYLNWLSQVIPATSTNMDLREFRIRALYLARASLQLKSQGIHVPYLNYESYAPLIDSILGVADQIKAEVTSYQQDIRQRKLAELQIDIGKTLNQNIRETGNLLTKYIASTANYQQDMAGYYDSVIQQQEKDFEQAVNNIEDLSSKLQSQQVVVDTAVEHFQTALGNYATEQIFQFAFSIVTDVFKLGVAIAALPEAAPAEATALAATTEKIKQLLEVLDNLSTLVQDGMSTSETLETVENALEAVGSQGADLPTALEWQEYAENMQLTLDNATRGISDAGVNNAKATLISGFKVLALRGQALLTAKSRSIQLSTEIYLKKQRQKVNRDQAARLNALGNTLNPAKIQDLDRSAVDLVGLTGQLQFQEKQLLLLLAQTLVVQDQALQYEYLGSPTPIASFDLLSLRTAIVQQKQSILTALSDLNPAPQALIDPIIYEIDGIPASALTGGNTYQFTIHPAAREFWQYAMVRIDRVLVETDFVQSTDSNQYILDLVYQGTPFEDRNQFRKPIFFNTVQRGFGPYLFDVGTNKPEFGNNAGSFDDSVTQITPFSQWQVSFPNSKTNQGIQLKGDFIKIRLKFYITALLRDPNLSRLNQLALSSPVNLANLADTAVSPTEFFADLPPAGSVNALLSEMYDRGSVLKGWDVVFNYTEENINQLLLEQYSDRQNNPDFFWQIPEQQFSQHYPPNVCTYTRWQLTLKAPQIQFLTNNAGFVQVRMDVDSGYIQQGSSILPAGEADCSKVSADKINWGEKQNISTSGYLQGNVPLGKLQGEVSTQHKVTVDLAKGAFLTRDLKVEVDNATLNAQLTNFLQSHNFTYTLGVLDYQDVTTLPSLTPTKFMFNTLQTNLKKNILQLYITTTGQQLSNLSIDVGEPIPDNFGCSLMINTKIMWQNIFVASFNKNGNVKVAADDPGVNYKTYSTHVTAGTVTGTPNFQGRDDLRISATSNQVTWDLTGLTFTPTESSGIQLTYDKTQTQNFQYHQYHPGICSRIGCAPGYYTWEEHSLDVTVHLTGTYGISVVGSGQNQQVQINSQSPTVTISGKLDEAGACKCNDRDLQQAFLDQLRTDVPAQIAQQIGGLPFTAISLFALKNLLFPQQNIINLKAAYVPGDLLVIGNFVQDKSNNSFSNDDGTRS